MRQIIEEKLHPIMKHLFDRIVEGGLELTIDGTPAYNEKAQFVGGKVINETCYVVLEFLKDEESFRKLGDVIRMVSEMPMETWGILNGISGLYRLKKAGLLEKVVDPETLEKLRISMDWRMFVDVENHYALIHKPTNYYGVAFGIARHRELLGWEKEGHSKILLDRLMEHIDQYSGEFSFMDETPGEGRFDRYSILVPSELASQLLATGWEVPEKIKGMLQKSARIFVELADQKGLGFSYGSSIGSYGATAALEVLSAAAEVGGLLTEDELEIAYGYSVKVMEHLVDFWYDKDMESINMWEHGRKTDNYRNKYRILGENLSLSMQMVNSYEHWVKAGYKEKSICGDYAEKLQKLPSHMYVPFAKGEYDRGLVIVRDRDHVWSLPFINGGQRMYDKDPYLPVPFQYQVLQGVPEYCHGQLIPQLWMEDGEVLMPVSYMSGIWTKEKDGDFTVGCHFDALCRMGEGISVGGGKTADSLVDNSVAGNSEENQRPKRVEGITNEVSYEFSHGEIKRTDHFKVTEALGDRKIKKIRLVLLSFSEKPEVSGDQVTFENGILTGMTAEGVGDCHAFAALDDGSFGTPMGRLNTEVVWSREVAPQETEIETTWTIRYQV